MHPVAAVPSVMPAGSPFDTITGLPVHPLVVHFAVVLLPLSALAFVAIVLVPRWRKPFGWVTMAGLFVGAGAAFVAKESGEQLADRVGLPGEHAELGDLLPIVAVVLLVVAAVWFWQARKASSTSVLGGGLQMMAAVLGIVLALAAAGLTVAVGHSGATAVWAGEIAATDTAAEAPGASAASSAPAAAGALTIDVVAQHAAPTDCWSAIDGTVYDLTDWIGEHPGGPVVVEALCGKDGSASFDGQHQGQGEPAQVLAGLEVGTLGASGTAVAVTPAAATVATKPLVKRYTMAQVKQHATAKSCWSAVNGKVYDLTRWVNRHPGGAQRILGMCGKNASAAFNGQHGGSSRVGAILAGYKIGRLG